MEKLRRCIKFDKNYLSSLKEASHSCVEVIKNVRHLSLHPFHLYDVNNSVKQILGEQIAKYDKQLNGILLSFENVKLLRSIGSISFDSSFTHIDIEAEFFVFKPEVGKVLHGVVNKKSKDHVGCLVHKFFNVSLPRPANCENWLGSVVQIGNEIEFCITFTNLEARLPYIKAEIMSLLSEDSGISTGEEGNNHAVNTITKFDLDELVDDNDDVNVLSQKKNRKRKFNKCLTIHDEDETEISHQKHKRSENETSFTLTGIIDYIGEEEEEISKRKKAKSFDKTNNDEANSKKRKKPKKRKLDTDVSQEDKNSSAETNEEVSKNKKMTREISGQDDLFACKRRKVASEMQDIVLEERSSILAKAPKYEDALKVSDMTGKTKTKGSAKPDLNFNKIYNETFTEKKSKNRKSRKVYEISTANESIKLQSVSKKKKSSGENSILFPELDLTDLPIQKPENTIKKSKKKKRENSGFDLLDLNFEDIINESVEEKSSNSKQTYKSGVKPEAHINSRSSMNSNISQSERKRSKSQPRSIEVSQSVSESEKKERKSQVRNLETNLARELFPSQIYKTEKIKRKKKKKRDSDLSLSQINFEDIINESTTEVSERKSKGSHKKKLRKTKVKDADESLPELNLDQLFTEDANKRYSTTSSHNNLSWQNKTFELPSDSDMENIFLNCFPKSDQKNKK